MHSIWSFSLFFQKWNHTAHIILLLSFLTWNIMAISCGKRCRSNLLFWMHCAVFNHIQLFATPWTVVRQAPLSMEFSRQEYWSGLPFPSPGNELGIGVNNYNPSQMYVCTYSTFSTDDTKEHAMQRSNTQGCDQLCSLGQAQRHLL